ncbi:hypothetical protein ACFM35_02720 [Microbacterium sp. P01]|uniref:hypothetical protein n=1 Tax=Microbacterium sp. P01 TaxID=3366261 RepID=UPI00366E4F52
MSPSERQRVEKVPGARRAKLTPAPDTTDAPLPADEERPDAPPTTGEASGPNDDRMRREKPPHY